MALPLIRSTLYEERLEGDALFYVAAEKHLKIETTPDGEEVLNTTVPAGRKWKVEVSVRIVETNA